MTLPLVLSPARAVLLAPILLAASAGIASAAEAAASAAPPRPVPAQGVPAAAPSPSASETAEAVNRLQPGEWYEAPHTRLDAVAAETARFPWLSGGVGGITACWAGGAFDSQRDRLYLGPGGGHAGYNGNEIYAFDVSQMKWLRLNDPDPVIPGTEYTDLNKAPFAMHTYDGVDYCPPPTDRYVVVGGWGTPRTYALNPDQPDRWEVYPDHRTGRTGDISAVDPTTGLLWLSTPITAGKLSQWDPTTHQWTLRRNESPQPSYYETADIDPKRHLLVACGHGRVKIWTLKPIPEEIPFRFLETTGDKEIEEASSPGFCYDAQIDKFVAWGKGPAVYTLDIDAGKWTKAAPAPTNAVTPGPPDQWGTFGRFRYVASRNVFILYNSVKQNVFFYRLTAGQPNVITGVEAKAVRKTIDAHLPAPSALAVQAVYADGTKKDVTQQAFYLSLTPDIAAIDGAGGLLGRKAGTARIRAVYTDPAFNRGFAAESAVEVKEPLGEARLEKVTPSYSRLVLAVGDSFPLEAIGSYARGQDAFETKVPGKIDWTSDAPQTASVSSGLVKGIHPGGPLKVKMSVGGKTAAAEVTVTDAPVIRRIRFQVKETFDRPGWSSDNGRAYSDERGFGWVGAQHLDFRDDRHAANVFLKAFVVAKENQFKIKTPPGPYNVRVAMGDADYGAVPFQEWTACGAEKIVYYEGQRNSVGTKVVEAGNDGLLFTVKGKINYLIVSPVGVDLDKYAEDTEKEPASPGAGPPQ